MCVSDTQLQVLAFVLKERGSQGGRRRRENTQHTFFLITSALYDFSEQKRKDTKTKFLNKRKKFRSSSLQHKSYQFIFFSSRFSNEIRFFFFSSLSLEPSYHSIPPFCRSFLNTSPVNPRSHHPPQRSRSCLLSQWLCRQTSADRETLR